MLDWPKVAGAAPEPPIDSVDRSGAVSSFYSSPDRRFLRPGGVELTSLYLGGPKAALGELLAGSLSGTLLPLRRGLG
jgi:hypothetical protein